MSLDSYIRWAGGRYSVPGHLVGEAVQVCVTLDGQMSVHHRDTVVATHAVSGEANATVTVDDHHAALWAEVRVSERDLRDYLPAEPVTACGKVA